MMIRKIVAPTGRTQHQKQSGFASPNASAADILASCGLALLPVLAVMGDYLPSVYVDGHPISPFRILTVLMFILGVATDRRNLWRRTLTGRSFVWVMGTWLTWGTTSLLWTPDPPRALVELGALAFGFLVVLVIIRWSGSSEPRYRALRFGWVLAVLASCATGAYEWRYGQHLASDHAAFMAKNYEHLDYVQSLFGNQNNFAAFLVLATPFLFHGLIETSRNRMCYVALLVMTSVALTVTSSRIGLISFCAQLMVALYLLRRTPGARHRNGRLGMVVCAIVLAFLASTNEQLRSKLAAWTGDSHRDQSTDVRANQMLNGLQCLIETRGVGVGAGGYQAFVTQRAKYNTYTWHGQIVDPHAAIVEIGAQYGLLVLVLVIRLLVQQFTFIHGAAKRTFHGKSHLHRVTIAGMGLVGLIGASFANSTFLPGGINWVFIGSLLLLTTRFEIDRTHQYVVPCGRFVSVGE